MKYLISILLIISILGIYVHHSITFNSESFEKEYNVKLNIKNDYIHYFYNQNNEPIYVFKNNILNKYVEDSFENKKNGLFIANQEFIADVNYISNIQYAASVPDAFTLKFLYNKLNYTTNLSPYWAEIYSFAQLILPINKLSKKFSNLEKIESWKKTVQLGEKGIKFTCNKEKIKNILELSDEKFFKISYSKTGYFYIINKNPCKDYNLPSNLGFNYFYYLKDLKNASKYYKVASFQEETTLGTIGMVSVINGILGEHEKALYMFSNKIIGLIKKLNKSKTKEEFQSIKHIIEQSQKRAIEELNFYILSKADKKGTECNKNYECLTKKGYIKIIINNLINKCSINPYIRKLKTFEDIEKYPIKISKDLSKCIFLKLSIDGGYIKKGEIYSPLIKNGTYKFDTKRGIWWVYRK